MNGPDPLVDDASRSALDDALRSALDDLACTIAGRPPGPAPPGSPEPPARRRLLLGAALLTGRGDLAQEAVHRAAARASPGAAGAPPRAAEHATLRAVRELRADGV